MVKRLLAIKRFYENQIMLTVSYHLNNIKCFILFQYKAESMNWNWWIIANFLALLTLYESEWPLALDGIVKITYMVWNNPFWHISYDMAEFIWVIWNNLFQKSPIYQSYFHYSIVSRSLLNFIFSISIMCSLRDS